MQLAMTMQEWIHEAKMYAEEVLDPEDFQALMKSPHLKSILEGVAIAGRGVYESMMDRVPLMVERGMDQMGAEETATDYAMEEMRASLKRHMEKVIPGFSKMYR